MHRNTFDDIRIDGALTEQINPFHLAGFFRKYFDKLLTDSLSFLFRIGFTSQLFVELLFCINTSYVQTNALISFQYLFKFIFAQDTVINKKTVESFTDGLIDQCGGYSG